MGGYRVLGNPLARLIRYFAYTAEYSALHPVLCFRLSIPMPNVRPFPPSFPSYWPKVAPFPRVCASVAVPPCVGPSMCALSPSFFSFPFTPSHFFRRRRVLCRKAFHLSSFVVLHPAQGAVNSFIVLNIEVLPTCVGWK